MTVQLPYCGSPPVPGELLTRFNLDPVLIVALLTLGGFHLWRLRGATRGLQSCAAVGWGIASAAFISPLCALSVSLFCARVGQHMILLLAAAPLIAYAWPMDTAGAADTSGSGRRWQLWTAAGAFFIALWFWHMPGPYDQTFTSTFVYWSMHVTLFGSGILLWRELLHHRAEQTAAALVAGVLTSIHMGLLGAVLTLAGHPLFLWHLFSQTQQWGFTPLQDQQLGGVFMWVPGMALFLWASVRSLGRLWETLEGAKTT